jgi:transcriptional regulator with XRE-family HTH domain
MRKSPLATTVAVLRHTIGWKQKEFATYLECSRLTLQNVELGRRPLSDQLAHTIALRTGVSHDWLLDGNPKQPPCDHDGKPYTRDSITDHMHRVINEDPGRFERIKVQEPLFRSYWAKHGRMMYELLWEALRQNKLEQVSMRLSDALHDIAPEVRGDRGRYT